jgi:hypothetical protein
MAADDVADVERRVNQVGIAIKQACAAKTVMALAATDGRRKSHAVLAAEREADAPARLRTEASRIGCQKRRRIETETARLKYIAELIAPVASRSSRGAALAGNRADRGGFRRGGESQCFWGRGVIRNAAAQASVSLPPPEAERPSSAAPGEGESTPADIWPRAASL